MSTCRPLTGPGSAVARGRDSSVDTGAPTERARLRRPAVRSPARQPSTSAVHHRQRRAAHRRVAARADMRTATGERHTTRRASSSATAARERRAEARVGAAQHDGGHVEQVHRAGERDAQRAPGGPQHGGPGPGSPAAVAVASASRSVGAGRAAAGPRARRPARGTPGHRRCTAVRPGSTTTWPSSPARPPAPWKAARRARCPRRPRSRRRRRGSRSPVPRLPLGERGQVGLVARR